MKVITGYADQRQERDAIAFDVEIGGNFYRIKEKENGKIQISAREGGLIIEPIGPNVIELGQYSF